MLLGADVRRTPHFRRVLMISQGRRQRGFCARRNISYEPPPPKVARRDAARAMMRASMARSRLTFLIGRKRTSCIMISIYQPTSDFADTRE